MENIDSGRDDHLGDEVVTAGIELGGGVRSPYPKGLLIGQVIDVQRDANGVVQTAFIQPTADLEKLEYVLVITDYDGGLPPIDQQPIDVRHGGHAAGRRAAVRHPDAGTGTVGAPECVPVAAAAAVAAGEARSRSAPRCYATAR